MGFLILKNISIAIFLGLIMSQSKIVSAHNQSGSFTTGLAAAVDFYQVTCSDDGNGAPSYLEAQIKDMTANTPKVNILVHKGTSCSTNKCAQSSTDMTDSDTKYSPLIRVTQGAGIYNIFVQHTTAGTDSYDLAIHCITATGVHTGTSVSSRQQQ